MKKKKSQPSVTVCHTHMHTPDKPVRYLSLHVRVRNCSYLHCTEDIMDPLSSLHLRHHLYTYMHTVGMRMEEERKENLCSSGGEA